MACPARIRCVPSRIVASLSAIANFMWLPYYPVWAIVVIAIDVSIIWALTAHGRDIASS